MTAIKYFKGINNIEDLKSNYKKLALQYHPDRPTGDLEVMKLINAEYDILFSQLKNVHKKTEKDGTKTTYTSTTETTEAPDDFKNIITELFKFNNIIIEVVGTWLWVTGETKPIAKELKSLGFFWNPKRQSDLWMKKPADDTEKHRYNKKENTEDLKNKYGCQKVVNKKTMLYI